MGKMRHRRLHKIPLQYCKDNCPKTGQLLKYKLLMRDEKLRDHAVRHLIYDEDAMEIWTKSFPHRINASEIEICRKELMFLGCLGSGINLKELPCLKKLKRCNLYDRCTKIVEELINKYAAMIHEAIKEGLGVPRYACCRVKKEETLWIMPDKRVGVIAGFYSNEGIYYIKTSFHINKGRSWHEARDYLRRRMERQSLNEPILCTEDTWFTKWFLLEEAYQKALKEKGEITNDKEYTK